MYSLTQEGNKMYAASWNPALYVERCGSFAAAIKFARAESEFTTRPVKVWREDATLAIEVRFACWSKEFVEYNGFLETEVEGVFDYRLCHR